MPEPLVFALVLYLALGHPILVVQGDSTPEMLIPFVQAYVLNVNTQNKLIQADWQEDY